MEHYTLYPAISKSSIDSAPQNLEDIVSWTKTTTNNYLNIMLSNFFFKYEKTLKNRPGVAGEVLQKTFVIHSFSE